MGIQEGIIRSIEDRVDRRKAAVRALFVPNPKLEEAGSVIDETRRRRRPEGKAFCSLVTGRSGVGKTRLFERYMAIQPSALDDAIPVLRLTVPPNHDERRLFTAMLQALREPIVESQRSSRVVERVVRALERRRVELVLFEEASHIVDKKAVDAKTPYRVTDAIKTYLLDGPYPVPIVMNGIPVAKTIFEINPQMETRRYRTIELEPLGFQGAGEHEPFKLLLEALEAEVAFGSLFLKGNIDAIRRFHWATDGVHAKVNKLFCEATELATHKGANGLSLQVLAEAFGRISDPGPEPCNPFLNEALPRDKQVFSSTTPRLHKRRLRE